MVLDKGVLMKFKVLGLMVYFWGCVVLAHCVQQHLQWPQLFLPIICFVFGILSYGIGHILTQPTTT